MRTRRPRRRGQDGMTSLEVVILFPLMIMLIMAVTQTALWYFARAAALAAARSGANVGSSYGSTPGDGAAAADRFAAAQAGDMLGGEHASPGGSTPDSVHITVTGDAISLVPGLPIHVSQSAQQPIEKFTRP